MRALAAQILSHLHGQCPTAVYPVAAIYDRRLSRPLISVARTFPNGYMPEQARGGGGQVVVAMKTGTNKYQGSVFEYLRNNALDARSFFAKSKEKLDYNDFGYSIGGPVMPHHENLTGTPASKCTHFKEKSCESKRVYGKFSARRVDRKPSTGEYNANRQERPWILYLAT